MGINRRDSVSVLAARIAARAVGRTLDDLNGIIFVRDVSYRYNDRELAADSVVIVGRNSLSDKFIRLRSDFVDADYEGRPPIKKYSPICNSVSAITFRCSTAVPAGRRSIPIR
ncbi:MAG: hypothetical protein ACLVJK_02075 [Alistipes putredinis]